MTTTQPAALPELPEPDIHHHMMTVWRDDVECEVDLGPRYTADQMRAYALAALQSQPAAAGVSDRVVKALLAQALFFKEGAHTVASLEADIRAILALRPQSESEQEKELRRSLAEAQATISERNAEIIELQKRIRRRPQAVPMTDEQMAEEESFRILY